MLRPLGVGSDLPPAQARPPPRPVYQGRYDPKALIDALKVYLLVICAHPCEYWVVLIKRLF
jgi:hypothetical protein